MLEEVVAEMEKRFGDVPRGYMPPSPVDVNEIRAQAMAGRQLMKGQA